MTDHRPYKEISGLLAKAQAELDLYRRAGVSVQLGGDMWCLLVGPDLQSGHAAFGATPEEAGAAFVKMHHAVCDESGHCNDCLEYMTRPVAAVGCAHDVRAVIGGRVNETCRSVCQQCGDTREIE